MKGNIIIHTWAVSSPHSRLLLSELKQWHLNVWSFWISFWWGLLSDLHFWEARTGPSVDLKLMHVCFWKLCMFYANTVWRPFQDPLTREESASCQMCSEISSRHEVLFFSHAWAEVVVWVTHMKLTQPVPGGGAIQMKLRLVEGRWLTWDATTLHTNWVPNCLSDITPGDTHTHNNICDVSSPLVR